MYLASCPPADGGRAPASSDVPPARAYRFVWSRYRHARAASAPPAGPRRYGAGGWQTHGAARAGSGARARPHGMGGGFGAVGQKADGSGDLAHGRMETAISTSHRGRLWPAARDTRTWRAWLAC